MRCWLEAGKYGFHFHLYRRSKYNWSWCFDKPHVHDICKSLYYLCQKRQQFHDDWWLLQSNNKELTCMDRRCIEWLCFWFVIVAFLVSLYFESAIILLFLYIFLLIASQLWCWLRDNFYLHHELIMHSSKVVAKNIRPKQNSTRYCVGFHWWFEGCCRKNVYVCHWIQQLQKAIVAFLMVKQGLIYPQEHLSTHKLHKESYSKKWSIFHCSSYCCFSRGSFESLCSSVVQPQSDKHHEAIDTIDFC